MQKHDQQKEMHLQYATVNMYFHQKSGEKTIFCVEDFLVASVYYFKKKEVLKWGGWL
jgi:hypothetical protein